MTSGVLVTITLVEDPLLTEDVVVIVMSSRSLIFSIRSSSFSAISPKSVCSSSSVGYCLDPTAKAPGTGAFGPVLPSSALLGAWGTFGGPDPSLSLLGSSEDGRPFCCAVPRRVHCRRQTATKHIWNCMLSTGQEDAPYGIISTQRNIDGRLQGIDGVPSSLGVDEREHEDSYSRYVLLKGCG